MIKIVLLQVIKSLLAAVFTERFLINLVLMLADWLVKRTSNDLDNQLVTQLRYALDKQQGRPVDNLYDRVKSKR